MKSRHSAILTFIDESFEASACFFCLWFFDSSWPEGFTLMSENGFHAERWNSQACKTNNSRLSFKENDNGW